MHLPLSDDFLSIVLNETPLLDVRAPIEFNKGKFINAVNIPILDDEERRLVGTKYKEAGNAAAIELAESLIKNEGKEKRVALWQEYLKENPDAKLYCFRGGQRSGISQEWLKEANIDITRLKGGYKAFRNFLIQQTEEISAVTPTLILGGPTGSGKTILLNKLQNAIDLEGIANHRGSSFGSFTNAQPSQIDFENNLAYKLIQFHHKDFNKLVLEHESHNIGRTFIPKPVYDNFMQGELVLLQTPLDVRARITYEEYVVSALREYEMLYNDAGLQKWAENVKAGLKRIQKRLGNQLYTQLTYLFDEAYFIHTQSEAKALYIEWITLLLERYYDPMYDYQIQKSPIPIVFQGDEQSVLDFIKKQETKI
ncbi:tRNA 2-selenouridine(34) synthase MnmH [Sulfurimonas autotrophica]|uniref:tRNA 2-selenouridine synthase n=1 Tax=Sulfurimonas autotrophica (strain ATCC BAA-671 / DSM 16294 / JCM 11897 / OK10) TaxID=563040 RepID=E0UTR4_SULAO|nr:tRNA 2-selenouridine(34) synthase MnmH [Sulfurimonas autotrophica]ADN08295.1 tRNA 2-selenouridine synthase [Sulfurimonas autotrophica DSM 16294]